MSGFKKTIDKLKSSKLSEYPVDEIKKLLSDFDTAGVIVMTLHKGKTIIRARPNEPDETFKTISEFSFKPSVFNKTYQRASTPLTTMFYGCVVPENIEKGELDNASSFVLLSKFVLG